MRDLTQCDSQVTLWEGYLLQPCPTSSLCTFGCQPRAALLWGELALNSSALDDFEQTSAFHISGLPWQNEYVGLFYLKVSFPLKY